MAKLKVSESDLDFDPVSNMDKGNKIIDVEPSAIVVTTQIQPKYLEEPEEGECLFHS